MTAISPWVEWVAAALLIVSGALAVIGAIGLVRMSTFFRRLHPPALANTLGAWCVCLASVVYFTAVDGRLSLQALLVNVMLAITAPITTVLLARAGLFRKRQTGDEAPAPMVRGPLGE